MINKDSGYFVATWSNWSERAEYIITNEFLILNPVRYGIPLNMLRRILDYPVTQRRWYTGVARNDLTSKVWLGVYGAEYVMFNSNKVPLGPLREFLDENS